VNRHLLTAALGCLLAVVSATTASGTTADFQCNCTFPMPNYCVCDATRTSSGGSGTSCGSASISQYFWDFGDGTSFFTTSSFVAHTYYGQQCVIYPKLAVFCSDGSSATRVHCYCNIFGVGGCIRPGAGWTP
jgi:hypothetical protein